MNYDKSILLVDDEEHFRERLSRALTNRGFTVFPAQDYDSAVEQTNRHKPDLAIVDLKMPGKSGLEVVKSVHRIHPEMVIIVLTGYGSISTATEAIKYGAFNYLSKPADVDEILNTFARQTDLETGVTHDDITPPSLARVEWEHINRVLTDCGGNISAAAKKLNIHRRTLQRKLQKYPPKT